jgi:hypothetical protein
MPDWDAIGTIGSDKPYALRDEKGERLEFRRPDGSPPIDPARETVLRRFTAPNQESAVRHFQGLAEHGIHKADPVYKSIDSSGLWRFRGSPEYLKRQTLKLRIPPNAAHRLHEDKELHRFSGLLAELCGRYHGLRVKDKGVAVLNPIERDQFRASLMVAKGYLDRMHLMAAAAEESLAEAWKAFGIEAPEKEIWVATIYDEKPKPEEPPATPAAVEADLPPAKTEEPETQDAPKPIDPEPPASTPQQPKPPPPIQRQNQNRPNHQKHAGAH